MSHPSLPAGRIALRHPSSGCGGVAPARVLASWLRRRSEDNAAHALRALALPGADRVVWTTFGNILEVRHA